jgi:hypothetical protein
LSGTPTLLEKEMGNALANYVSNKNRYRFKSDIIAIPKANANPDKLIAKAKKIFNLLDTDLSPENLYADGEISKAAAKKKEKALIAAWKELETIIGKKFDSMELYS